ncbi:MAG: kelch repeat-containing protein, partial [Roseiflexaceae bacterium]
WPFPGYGSVPLTAAEIYDPASGEWHATGPTNEQRTAHTATLLLDGRVLVVGTLPYAGVPYPAPGSAPLLPGTEVYSSTTDTWTPGTPLATPRWGHTATLLPDGRVVIIGGYSWYDQVQSSVEIFDPASNRWSAARPLSSLRAYHTATLLADGTILVVGGTGLLGALDTAERYDPSNAQLGIQHYLSSILRPDINVPPFFPPTFPPFFPTPTPSP